MPLWCQEAGGKGNPCGNFSDRDQPRMEGSLANAQAYEPFACPGYPAAEEEFAVGVNCRDDANAEPKHETSYIETVHD